MTARKEKNGGIVDYRSHRRFERVEELMEQLRSGIVIENNGAKDRFLKIVTSERR